MALYERVSGRGQALKGGSLGDQHKVLTLWTADNYGRVADTYKDPGISGHSANRAELQRLLADARLRKIDLVICTMVDRFFRENRLLLNTVYELKDELGIDLITTDGQFSTRNGDWKFTLALLGALAEKEHDILSKRQKAVRKRQNERHEWSLAGSNMGSCLIKPKEPMTLNT